MKSAQESGIALLVGALVMAPLPAAAQADDEDTILVTASRLQLTDAQIGSAITVITAEQLESGQILLGKDVLQDVPGVQISNDRPGALTGVYLRGSRNEHVLVLLDGQELGDPSNLSTSFQFDHLRAADIERIEVLRGNQSSLYGSDAIGGVINIITRRPDADGLDVSVDAEAGSYGMRRVDAGVSGRSGSIDYRFSLDSLSLDGPSMADPNLGPAVEDDAYDSLGFGGRVGFAFTPALRLDLQGFTSETATDLDGTGEDAAYWPRVDKDESNLGATLVHAATGGRWRNELSLNTYEAERVYQTTADRWTGQKDNARFSTMYEISSHFAVAVGLDHETESTDQLTGFSGNFIAENETDSGFAELAVIPNEALTLTFAARRDDNERFGAFDTGRVTAAWSLATAGPATKLRASWGTGAKAPGLYQLFDPAVGNPELGVEESTGYDMGVDLFWPGGATVEVTYFNNDLENEIDFAFPSGYLNLGSTRAKGIETYVTVPLGERLDWSLTYTYLDSRDDHSELWLGRPRNTATSRLAFDLSPKLNLAARVRYRSLNAASFGGATDSFVVIDLLGSYELANNIEIYGRIVNLFDEDYQYEWGSSTYDLSAFAGIRIRY